MNFFNLTSYALQEVNKPVKFTLQQWYIDNTTATRNSLAQQELADKIIAESNRLTDEIDEVTRTNKQEVDHKLAEKVNQIEFLKNEVELLRKQVGMEIDTLNLFLIRLEDTQRGLQESCMAVCMKCLYFRDQRIGIDLCIDYVQKELQHEANVIQSAQQLVSRAYGQVTEQIRVLRSCLYFIDRDLEDKSRVLEIDSDNKDLRETSLNLSMYHGHTKMDVATITGEEWEQQSMKNIETAAKEVNAAIQLRTFINVILKEAIEDCISQYNLVNDAFKRRIEETKFVKNKLEMDHSEIVRQVNEMTRNITKLEVAITEKEGFMALSHTRLGRRAHRPGAELCRDMVDTSLIEEVRVMRNNIAKLQHMLCESQASLRYLLKCQISVEENLNIKLNTLKIDEVNCMTLREGMNYKFY
ncbi:tektin-1-like [Coccinella septempunctata]|uniref:tektin-1-like n=1 Tax=Coccinella septempunctata TaxID=41139 RepID=UPI001D06715D|nr:tektin-1-like [Coccinella septempunctata]